jgi:DNA-binding LytR/AlgR family response regulator
MEFKQAYVKSKKVFVNSFLLRSTLREMQILGRSPRLWLTFGAVVLLFAVTGPYGSAERLAFLPRFAYWLLLHAGAWFLALTASVLADVVLGRRLDSMFLRMLVGSLIATFPIGLVIGILEWSWFGVQLTWTAYLDVLPTILPLSAIFCVISYLAMSDAGSASPGAGPDAPAGPTAGAGHDGVPLLNRLRPESRGPLIHISVEDHYSRIRTTRGSELVLLRFADAIREAAGADGLQVHRSHWVARDSVEGFRHVGGKLLLVLKDGTEVPVSRTYRDNVRARFARLGSGEMRGNR